MEFFTSILTILLKVNFFKCFLKSYSIHFILEFIQIGNYSLKIKASPLTFDVIYNVSKLVNFNETHTLFDTWLDNEPNALKTMPKYFNTFRHILVNKID